MSTSPSATTKSRNKRRANINERLEVKRKRNGRINDYGKRRN